MKVKIFKKLIVFLVVFSTVLCACGAEEIIDPHAGQVYLYDGFDWIWYTPLDGVEVNSLSKDDFNYISEPVYIGNEFSVKKGIDVSEWQYDIEWDKVAAQNLDFIYVRCGRRGYTEGGLFEDANFKVNIEGAKKSANEVGVYFYSQAITVGEAIEEANYVLELIKGYKIDLPIAFDWEKIDDPTARTNNLDIDTLTSCAVAFCETIKQAGYEPIVYYNRTFGYYRYDLTRLKDYKVWFALPCTPPDVTFPSFYYHIDIWQYSQTARIAGINADVDLNYFFTPINE